MDLGGEKTGLWGRSGLEVDPEGRPVISVHGRGHCGQIKQLTL